MTRRELILYATPEGELAEQCRLFFDTLRDSGRSTTAQTYPPHVTLTGFFHRDANVTERTIADVAMALGSSTFGPVVVDSLQVTDEWVGLAISSDWLIEVATAFAARQQLGSWDDPIRLKDWLHLSLAYGDVPRGATIGECAALARSAISIDAPTTWSVGLWERRGLAWTRHS